MFGRFSGRIIMPSLAIGFAACSGGGGGTADAAIYTPAVQIQAAHDTASNTSAGARPFYGE